MLPSIKNFDELPLYFEGNSRILRHSFDPDLLICKLKPTVFSLQEKGPIVVPGIDSIRTQLNALICDHLHKHGIRTSTVVTEGEFIVMEKQEVAPIEVVVKGALVGSPKHIYKGIDQADTRFKTKLNRKHDPYVRFDWRNPLPYEDQCMPTSLANYFIDVEEATKTGLQAFEILQDYFRKHDLELLDICFFMNTEGNVICAEVSTDNSRLEYVGTNLDVAEIIDSKAKNMSLERAKAILTLLK